MAFKSVKGRKKTDNKINFWKPSKEGEQIIGHICDFVDDKYKNTCPVLATGTDDETGKLIMTRLPGHTALIKQCEDLKLGDYIRVTYLGMKQPKQAGKRGYNDYEVEIDESQFSDEYNRDEGD